MVSMPMVVHPLPPHFDHGLLGLDGWGSPDAKPIIISNPTVSKAKEAAAKFNMPHYTGDAMEVNIIQGGGEAHLAHERDCGLLTTVDPPASLPSQTSPPSLHTSSYLCPPTSPHSR